jgi:starch-binding outer membrane protein, SusD/RagB family
MKLKYIIHLVALMALSGVACTKDALNQKPDATIAIPTTISDFQQMLDGLEGGAISNAPGLFSYRSLGDYLSDELTVTDNNYNTYFKGTPFVAGVVTWDKNMFSSLTSTNGCREWDNQYKIILSTNVALEGLSKIAVTGSNRSSWNLAEGIALFIRGQLFYNLAQFWAKPYNAATASTDPGIVLRTHSDASAASVRSTVKESYDQILNDLKDALPLLPNTSSENTQLSKVRPSKAAAYGALARTYLAMGDSVNMEKYADSALQLYSTLMDYNSLSYFSNFNAEMVYSSVDFGGTPAGQYGPWNIDTNFIKSYDADDLRKTLFFVNSAYAGGYVFIGDYSGNYAFTGIAVDELYLLRAEGNARLSNTADALADLNTLLVKRYKSGTFVPRTAVDAGDALAQVITERRKELVMRGCRWTDLRRLNTDSRFAVTLSRKLLGVSYTLPPNDSRYTLQIPAYIISASNGSIAQNP